MRLTRRFGRDERRLPEIGSRCLRRPRFASSCRRPRFVHFLGSPAICLSFHFFFPPLFPSPFSSPLSPRSRCEYPPPPCGEEDLSERVAGRLAPSEAARAAGSARGEALEPRPVSHCAEEELVSVFRNSFIFLWHWLVGTAVLLQEFCKREFAKHLHQPT